jgi:hypothetical protein
MADELSGASGILTGRQVNFQQILCMPDLLQTCHDTLDGG